MSDIRKQQCQTAQEAFATVYDKSLGEQYHVISLQEINVALAKKGLPSFKDKHELEEAMVSEFVAEAKDPEAAEEVVRYWIQNAVLD